MSTRIYRACDMCEAETGQDAPGEPWGPIFGRMVDLCTDHRGQFAWLEDFAMDRGVPVEGKTPRRARAARKAPGTDAQAAPVSEDGDGSVCPLCGLQLPAGGTAVRDHLTRRHDITARDLIGTTCPVCGGEAGRLGAHVFHSHHPDLGLRNAADAIEWARVNGDPHGVYAARIAPRLAS